LHGMHRPLCAVTRLGRNLIYSIFVLSKNATLGVSANRREGELRVLVRRQLVKEFLVERHRAKTACAKVTASANRKNLNTLLREQNREGARAHNGVAPLTQARLRPLESTGGSVFILIRKKRATPRKCAVRHSLSVLYVGYRTVNRIRYGPKWSSCIGLRDSMHLPTLSSHRNGRFGSPIQSKAVDSGRVPIAALPWTTALALAIPLSGAARPLLFTNILPALIKGTTLL
jgi:hypothetical protein